MTRPDGTPDPGAPETTDEEAVEAELAEDSPVAPEAEAVTDGAADIAADQGVEGEVVDEGDFDEDQRFGGE